MPNIPISITITDDAAKASLRDLKLDFEKFQKIVEEPLKITLEWAKKQTISSDFKKFKAVVENPLKIKFDEKKLASQFKRIKSLLNRIEGRAILDVKVKFDPKELDKIANKQLSTEINFTTNSEQFTTALSAMSSEFDTWLDSLPDIYVFFRQGFFENKLAAFLVKYRKFKRTIQNSPINAKVYLDFVNLNELHSIEGQLKEVKVPVRFDLQEVLQGKNDILSIYDTLKDTIFFNAIDPLVNTSEVKKEFGEISDEYISVKKSIEKNPIKLKVDTSDLESKTKKTFDAAEKTSVDPKLSTKDTTDLKSKAKEVIHAEVKFDSATFVKEYKSAFAQLRKDITAFKNKNRIELKVFINKHQINKEFKKVLSNINSLDNDKINIKVKSNAKKAGREITKLQNKLNSLTGRTYNINFNIESVKADIREIREELAGLNRSVKTSTKSAGRLFSGTAAGAKASTKEIKNSYGALRVLGDDLQRILAAGFFLHIAKQAVSAANEFISMNNALKAILETTENAAKANMFLRATAQDLGVSYKVLTVEYTKFIAAGKEANITADEFHDAFSRISETMTVLNFSAEQTHGIFKALTQIMSKGKVQAEELRGQLGEHLPGAFELVAKGLKVTTAELDELLKKGELDARDLIIALPNAMKEAFGDALPRALVTGRAEFQRFVNDISILLDDNREDIDDYLFGIANTGRQISAAFFADPTLLKSFGVALEILADVVKEIVIVMSAGFSLIGNLLRNNEEYVNTAFQAWKDLYSAAKDVVITLVELADALGIFTAIGIIMNAIVDAIAGIAEALSAVFSVVRFIAETIGSVFDLIAPGSSNIGDQYAESYDNISTAANSAGGDIRNFREELIALNEEFKGEELKKASLDLYEAFKSEGSETPEMLGAFKDQIDEIDLAMEKAFQDNLKKANKTLETLKVNLIKVKGELNADQLGSKEHLINRQFKGLRSEVGNRPGIVTTNDAGETVTTPAGPAYDAQRKQALELTREIELIKQQVKAKKEAATAAAAANKFVEDTLQKLKEENILLTEGSSALEEYKLKKMGINEVTRERISALQQENEIQKVISDKKERIDSLEKENAELTQSAILSKLYSIAVGDAGIAETIQNVILDNSIEKLKAKNEEIKKSIKANKDLISSLDKRSEKAKVNNELLKHGVDITDELRIQVSNLSSAEKENQSVKLKATKDLESQNAKLKERIDLVKSAEKVTKDTVQSLQEESIGITIGADALQAYKLRKQGVTEANIEYIQTLEKENEIEKGFVNKEAKIKLLEREHLELTTNATALRVYDALLGNISFAESGRNTELDSSIQALKSKNNAIKESTKAEADFLISIETRNKESKEELMLLQLSSELNTEISEVKNELTISNSSLSDTEKLLANGTLESISIREKEIEQIKEQIKTKEQVEKIVKSTIESLKEESIAITEGALVAEQYKLQKKGLSESNIQLIQSIRAENDSDKRIQTKKDSLDLAIKENAELKNGSILSKIYAFTTSEKTIAEMAYGGIIGWVTDKIKERNEENKKELQANREIVKSIKDRNQSLKSKISNAGKSKSEIIRSDIKKSSLSDSDKTAATKLQLENEKLEAQYELIAKTNKARKETLAIIEKLSIESANLNNLYLGTEASATAADELKVSMLGLSEADAKVQLSLMALARATKVTNEESKLSNKVNKEALETSADKLKSQEFEIQQYRDGVTDIEAYSEASFYLLGTTKQRLAIEKEQQKQNEAIIAGYRTRAKIEEDSRARLKEANKEQLIWNTLQTQGAEEAEKLRLSLLGFTAAQADNLILIEKLSSETERITENNKEYTKSVKENSKAIGTQFVLAAFGVEALKDLENAEKGITEQTLKNNKVFEDRIKLLIDLTEKTNTFTSISNKLIEDKKTQVVRNITLREGPLAGEIAKVKLSNTTDEDQGPLVEETKRLARLTKHNDIVEKIIKANKAYRKSNDDLTVSLTTQELELTKGKIASDEYLAAQNSVSESVIRAERALVLKNEAHKAEIDLLLVIKGLKESSKKAIDSEIERNIRLSAGSEAADRFRLSLLGLAGVDLEKQLALENIIRNLGQANTIIEDNKSKAEEDLKTYEQISKELQDEYATLTLTNKELVKYNQLIFNAKVNNMDITEERKEYLKTQKQINNEIKNQENLLSLQDVFHTLEDAAVDFTLKFSDALIDSIETGKFAFKDLAYSAIIELEKILAKQLIVNAAGSIGDAINPEGSGLLGLLFGQTDKSTDKLNDKSAGVVLTSDVPKGSVLDRLLSRSEGLGPTSKSDDGIISQISGIFSNDTNQSLGFSPLEVSSTGRYSDLQNSNFFSAPSYDEFSSKLKTFNNVDSLTETTLTTEPRNRILSREGPAKAFVKTIEDSPVFATILGAGFGPTGGMIGAGIDEAIGKGDIQAIADGVSLPFEIAIESMTGLFEDTNEELVELPANMVSFSEGLFALQKSFKFLELSNVQSSAATQSSSSSEYTDIISSVVKLFGSDSGTDTLGSTGISSIGSYADLGSADFFSGSSYATIDASSVFADLFSGSAAGGSELVGSAASGGSELLGSAGTELFSGIASAFSGIGFAKGGAFNQSGQITKFASGGIFDSPSSFSFGSSSLGVLGEAGPEAIMPLSRTSDGSLGISSSGSDYSGAVTGITTEISKTLDLFSTNTADSAEIIGMGISEPLEEFAGETTNILGQFGTGIVEMLGSLNAGGSASNNFGLGYDYDEPSGAYKAVGMAQGIVGILGSIVGAAGGGAAGGAGAGAGAGAGGTVSSGLDLSSFATQSSFGYANGGVISGGANVKAFANGGVISGGNSVSAFANGGIVDRPTNFPMNNGIGLAGEAGAEGILPLKRGRNGKLGVQTDDAQSKQQPINNNIVNVLDPDLFDDYVNSEAGEKRLLNFISNNSSAIGQLI